MRTVQVRRLGILAAALAAALGFAVTGAPAQASAAQSGATVGPQFIGSAFALVNRASGMCLEVAGGSLEDNAPLAQNDCHPNNSNVTDPNQNWLPVSVGSGQVNLHNLQSGQCLDFAAATVGHTVKQHVCGSDLFQKWRITVSEVPGFLRLVSAANGGNSLCLDNSGSSASGAISIIWTCETGNSNQLWRQA